MSHEDSLDDETKRILAEVDTDDSKESNNSKKKNKISWEVNHENDDDKEW